MKLRLIALLAGLSLASVGFAEETTTESSTTSKTKIEKPTGDIDNEITNRKLQNELGSKSKYSMSLNMNYAGGPMEQIQSKHKRNTGGGLAAPEVRGDIAIDLRYRLSKRASVTAGIGVGVIQPFHEPQSDRGTLQSGNKRPAHNDYFDKTEITDPWAKYTYAKKMGPIQTVWSSTLYLGASQDSIDDGYIGALSGANTMVWSPKQVSDLSFILVTSGSYSAYRDNSRRVDWALAFYPIAEYVLNDKLNLRTVFRPFTFRHQNDVTEGIFDKAPGSQSFGLGISVSRNVYLYPNFQLTYADLEKSSFATLDTLFGKNTTVGINANINMF